MPAKLTNKTKVRTFDLGSGYTLKPGESVTVPDLVVTKPYTRVWIGKGLLEAQFITTPAADAAPAPKKRAKKAKSAAETGPVAAEGTLDAQPQPEPEDAADGPLTGAEDGPGSILEVD